MSTSGPSGPLVCTFSLKCLSVAFCQSQYENVALKV